MEWVYNVQDYLTDIEWVEMNRDYFTGRTELTGASYDSLLLFAVAGFALVVLHALFKLVFGKRKPVVE